MTEDLPKPPAECEDFLHQIVYLIDNELDEADMCAVRAHLEACARCLRTYDLERTVKALVARSCAESAPEALRAKVLLSIRQVRVQFTEG